MYNEKQKYEFIEYTINNSSSIHSEGYRAFFISLFNSISNCEMVLEQDISEMNFESLKWLVGNSFTNFSVGAKTSNLSSLRKYVSWCIENDKTSSTENLLKLIKIADIQIPDFVKMKYIKSPEELKNKCFAVFADADKQTNDKIFSGLLFLIFMGFTYDESVLLKSQNNKDLANGIEGREIYKPFFETIYEMNNMDIILKRRGSNFCTSVRTDILDSEYLIKRKYYNDVEKFCSSIRSQMSRRIAQYNQTNSESISLIPYDIFKSGIFYRMKMKEIETGIVDYSEYFSRLLNETSEGAMVGYKDYKSVK